MNITKEMIENKASETELYEDGYKGFISGAEWILSLLTEQKLLQHGVIGKRQLIEKILFDYMENTKTYNETVNRILAACATVKGGKGKD